MNHAKKILVVDDEPEHCLAMSQALTAAGYQPQVAPDGSQAITLSRQQRYDLYLLDIRMHPVDGIQVLQEIRTEQPQTPAIMLSAFGDVDTAVKCMKLGAYDFVTKPVNLDELLITVANALRSVELQQEVETLRSQIELQQSPERLLGESAPMRELQRTLEQIARHNLSVLIRGESGTGKELAARALHALSQRAAAPFVSVDCATLPETLVESELFGYERGAFTGAVAQKSGRFELAGEGSLFLDEIGNLSEAVQVKLLRVLQERSFLRLGGKEEHPFRATLISATNVQLETRLREGSFREDLYYRLNEFVLHLPPLRERREDIPLLVKHFLDLFNRQFGKRVQGVQPEAEALLLAAPWPGNVRELKNVIKRGVVLADDWIERRHLPEEILAGPVAPPAGADPGPVADPDGRTLKEIVKLEVQRLEQRVIRESLDLTRWNRTLAAKRLGVDAKTLYNKMRQYGLE